MAGVFVLIYVHLVNTLTTHILHAPMAGIFGTFCYMNLSNILTESNKIITINTLASFIELVLHALKVIHIFQDAFSEEQTIQIWSGLVASFIAFGYLSIISFIRKNVEAGYWDLAQTNFEKSEALTKEVIQAIDAKDTFVSSLSHEVRNVLNALNGSIEHLSMALKDSSYMQILKNAKLSGEILLNLVNNALDAAKIKADKLELSYGTCEFDDVIRKTFIVNAENLKTKNITAQALVDGDVPKELWIDSGRVLQVMMNLVSNAIKFTPKNGKIFIHAKWLDGIQDTSQLLSIIEDANNEIFDSNNPRSPLKKRSRIIFNGVLDPSGFDRYQEFNDDEGSKHRKNMDIISRSSGFNNIPRVSKTEAHIPTSENWNIKKIPQRQRKSSHSQRIMESQFGYLKIQVSDTGCGISEQSISKLFGMYNQANSSISSTHGGTGLGLWISKQLTQKMNGDIAVYSERDKGTQFVFYIPVNLLQTSSISTTNTLKLRDKVNVLVVDDFAFNRNLHKLLLEREGAQVTLANDGHDAVQKYMQRGGDYFDVIMMDVNMPGMDGFSAAIKIREWEEANNVRKVGIYFVSGDYFSEDDIITALKAKGKIKDLSNIRFLRKPIELEVVSNIIKKLN